MTCTGTAIHVAATLTYNPHLTCKAILLKSHPCHWDSVDRTTPHLQPRISTFPSPICILHHAVYLPCFVCCTSPDHQNVLPDHLLICGPQPGRLHGITLNPHLQNVGIASHHLFVDMLCCARKLSFKVLMSSLLIGSVR